MFLSIPTGSIENLPNQVVSTRDFKIYYRRSIYKSRSVPILNYDGYEYTVRKNKPHSKYWECRSYVSSHGISSNGEKKIFKLMFFPQRRYKCDAKVATRANDSILYPQNPKHNHGKAMDLKIIPKILKEKY
jgi:hypothetical protein